MSRAVNIARRALSVEDDDDEDEDDGCLLQHDDATPVYKMTTIRSSAAPGSDGSVPEAPASVDAPPARGSGASAARSRRVKGPPSEPKPVILPATPLKAPTRIAPPPLTAADERFHSAKGPQGAPPAAGSVPPNPEAPPLIAAHEASRAADAQQGSSSLRTETEQLQRMEDDVKAETEKFEEMRKQHVALAKRRTELMEQQLHMESERLKAAEDEMRELEKRRLEAEKRRADAETAARVSEEAAQLAAVEKQHAEEQHLLELQRQTNELISRREQLEAQRNSENASQPKALGPKTSLYDLLAGNDDSHIDRSVDVPIAEGAADETAELASPAPEPAPEHASGESAQQAESVPSDADGLPPAHHAAANGLLASLQGQNLEALYSLDAAQRSPLFYACANDQPDCAEFLLSRAAHCLNLADSNGDTPLHAAVSAGSLRCTKILLSHAAHSEAANALGMKPLHLAQNRGCLEGAQSPAPLYHARNTSPSEPTLSRRVFSASARRREHGCRGQPQADTALCRERDESRGLRRLLDRRARERGGDASFRPSRRYAASRSRVQRSGGVRAVAAPVGHGPERAQSQGIPTHRARGKARAPWLREETSRVSNAPLDSRLLRFGALPRDAGRSQAVQASAHRGRTLRDHPQGAARGPSRGRSTAGPQTLRFSLVAAPRPLDATAAVGQLDRVRRPQP